MKATTKKLLTWLFPPEEGSVRLVRSPDITWLFPELSAAGFRSLLAYAEKRNLIAREVIQDQLHWRITTYGTTELSEVFPVLSPFWREWHGDWAVLTFLEAPKTDPQFRYLRHSLLQIGAQPLTRGVFLYPHRFPAKTLEVCQKLYINSVLITGIETWYFGDERKIVSDIFNLSDLLSIYSGISKEINQLLAQKNKNLDWNDQTKPHLLLVFNRILTCFLSDLGIANHYFPQEEGGKVLLAKLQALLRV